MYLDQYSSQISRICRENDVKSLYAFGSVLTDRFSEVSDIDLIVEIASQDPLEYGRNYFNFLFALQDLLQRPIDLIENIAIRNKYFISAVEETKELVYG